MKVAGQNSDGNIAWSTNISLRSADASDTVIHRYVRPDTTPNNVHRAIELSKHLVRAVAIFPEVGAHLHLKRA